MQSIISQIYKFEIKKKKANNSTENNKRYEQFTESQIKIFSEK